MSEKRVYHKMTKIGLCLWFTGVVKMYKDGDTFSIIFRWYHPTTWLFVFFSFFIAAFDNESSVLDFVPIRLSKFWLRNIDQMQWVTPFTKINSLKNFNHTVPLEDVEFD